MDSSKSNNITKRMEMNKIRENFKQNMRKDSQKDLLREGIRTVGLVRNKQDAELEKVLDMRNREIMKKLFPSHGTYSPRKAEKKAGTEEMENRKRRAAKVLVRKKKEKKPASGWL